VIEETIFALPIGYDIGNCEDPDSCFLNFFSLFVKSLATSANCLCSSVINIDRNYHIVSALRLITRISLWTKMSTTPCATPKPSVNLGPSHPSHTMELECNRPLIKPLSLFPELN